MATFRILFMIVLACAATGLAILAPLPSEAAPAKTKIRKADAKRYRLPMKGSDIDLGGARIAIDAPLPVVRKVVMSFGMYNRIIPRLKMSRVVSRRKNQTDVYLSAPIFNGLTKLWAVTRFSTVKRNRYEEVIVGRLVKGNLEQWYGRWRLRRCSRNRTLLKMELFADVKIPLPAEMVTEELQWVADKSVTAVRAIAECRHKKRRARPRRRALRPRPRATTSRAKVALRKPRSN